MSSLAGDWSVVPLLGKSELLHLQWGKLSAGLQTPRLRWVCSAGRKGENGDEKWIKGAGGWGAVFRGDDGWPSFCQPVVKRDKWSRGKNSGSAFVIHMEQRFEMSAPILLWLNRCLHKAVC